MRLLLPVADRRRASLPGCKHSSNCVRERSASAEKPSRPSCPWARPSTFDSTETYVGSCAQMCEFVCATSHSSCLLRPGLPIGVSHPCEIQCEMSNEHHRQNHCHLLVHYSEGAKAIESWLEASCQLIHHQNQKNRIDDLKQYFLVHRLTCAQYPTSPLNLDHGIAI